MKLFKSSVLSFQALMYSSHFFLFSWTSGLTNSPSPPTIIVKSDNIISLPCSLTYNRDRNCIRPKKKLLSLSLNNSRLIARKLCLRCHSLFLFELGLGSIHLINIRLFQKHLWYNRWLDQCKCWKTPVVLESPTLYARLPGKHCFSIIQNQTGSQKISSLPWKHQAYSGNR